MPERKYKAPCLLQMASSQEMQKNQYIIVAYDLI